MPVRKYRTLEQAEASCWLDPENPLLERRIAFVWQLSQALAPRHFKPGVHKHRSLDEARAFVEHVPRP